MVLCSRDCESEADDGQLWMCNRPTNYTSAARRMGMRALEHGGCMESGQPTWRGYGALENGRPAEASWHGAECTRQRCNSLGSSSKDRTTRVGKEGWWPPACVPTPLYTMLSDCEFCLQRPTGCGPMYAITTQGQQPFRGLIREVNSAQRHRMVHCNAALVTR
jgi:hypothetical protein